MVADILQVMLQREMKYNSPHFVQSTPSFMSVMEDHRKWRSDICQWYYAVVDHLEIDREIVSFAIDYFDRFVTITATANTHTSERTDIAEYQLFALTCLYVATKTHSRAILKSVNELNGMNVGIKSFVSLSRNRFVAENIVEAERCLLFTLEWNINTVSPLSFVRYMLTLLDKFWKVPSHAKEVSLQALCEISSYITELAICMPEMTEMKTLSSTDTAATLIGCYVPSYVAFISILISMELFTTEAIPNEIRTNFTEIMSSNSKNINDNHICYFLHSENEDIQHLMSILRKDFHPEVVIDQAMLCDQHPITIALNQGLIDLKHLSNNSIQGQDEDFVESQVILSDPVRNLSNVSPDIVSGIEIVHTAFDSPNAVHEI